MATLNSISSQIIRKLSGGDQSVDSTTDRRDVILRIRQALNELIKLEIVERKGNDGDRTVNPTYIATYLDIPITKGRYGLESEIPSFYLSLPHNAGLHHLSLSSKPMDGEMMRRNNPFVSVSLEAGSMEGNMSYWVEKDMCFYDKHVQITEKKTVEMRLIIGAPDDLGNNDQLPILPEQEGVLLDIVTQRMAKITMEDHGANNVDESTPVISKKE